MGYTYRFSVLKSLLACLARKPQRTHKATQRFYPPFKSTPASSVLNSRQYAAQDLRSHHKVAGACGR